MAGNAAAAALAYVPNAAAQALSGRSSRLVGAVVEARRSGDRRRPGVPDARTRVQGQGWSGLRRRREGCHEECVRRLVARGVDAIVFCGGATLNEPGARRRACRVPCASLDDAVAAEASARSGFDRTKAFALGARYLQQLGHVRVGFLAIGGHAHGHDLQRELAVAGITFRGPAGTGGAASAGRWRGPRPLAASCRHLPQWSAGAMRPRLRCWTNAGGAIWRCRRSCRSSALAIPNSPDRHVRRCPRSGSRRARRAKRWPEPSRHARKRPTAPTELFGKLVARESTGPTRADQSGGTFHVKRRGRFHVERLSAARHRERTAPIRYRRTAFEVSFPIART